MTTKTIQAIVALCVAVGAARADEGMWMPPQIPSLEANLRAIGYEGDPKSFADLTGQPMGAVVSLGGCSASFVSPEGLIVTNHHCITGALQYNSTPERNLLEDGLIARSRADEVWSGPGTRAYVTTEVLELTAELERALAAATTDRARQEAVEKFTKEKTAACESDGSRCRIASFFGGLRWFQIRQTELQDLRLVYAPAVGVGRFGGETDNFRWPRHTGDFSFYRAYVGPDGKPAPHSKDNVPYRPKRWLRISAKGASPGDVIFVAGYPGSTDRYQTPVGVTEDLEWRLPRSIRRAEEQLAILDELAKESPELAIKVEARRRGIHNGLTKNRGVLEGMLRSGARARTEERQRDLQAWIQADAARAKTHGGVVAAKEEQERAGDATRDRDATFRALYGNGSLLNAADTLHELAVNRPKPDLEREPAVQQRNWTRLRDGLQRMQRTLDPKVDRALLRYVLLEASRLPVSQRIPPLDKLAGFTPGAADAESARAVDAFLDRLYVGTKLTDADFRLAQFDKSTADLLATKDSFVELAAALYPFQEQLRAESEARQGAGYRVAPPYMKALLAERGGLVAPDANGTLRVSYGRVEGVAPRDGLRYTPQTTVSGQIDKVTGEGDFKAPAKLLEAAAALRSGKRTPYQDSALGDVPVNFLSTADTTGGNSGSATLNSRGELCGLAFDGTYDTVVSDVLYDTRTRAIHVDSRYLLWVLSEVDGAKSLLQELGH